MKPITDYKFTPDLLTSNEYFWNCHTPEELAIWHENPKDQYQALLAIVQNDKKLFTLITTTVPTLQGWCSNEKACVLAALTLATKPIHAIELGVFGGRSLLPVAMAMKAIGSGMITGIDPYSPQESASGQFTTQDEEWWSKLDHKSIRDQFMLFVRRFGLERHVQLIEKPSGAVDTSNMSIQMLHIDGNHGEQSVYDAEKYGPLVRTGGFVLNDDIFWAGGSPLRAIESLEEMGFVEVFRRTEGGDNWNLMQKAK